MAPHAFRKLVAIQFVQKCQREVRFTPRLREMDTFRNGSSPFRTSTITWLALPRMNASLATEAPVSTASLRTASLSVSYCPSSSLMTRPSSTMWK
jgi:hypothetical protein